MDQVQSHFVLNSTKPVPAIDPHMDVRPAQKIEEPVVDVQTQALKLFKKLNKVYDRVFKSSINVFEHKRFILEDLLIRDIEEMTMITNWRMTKYNETLKNSHRFFNKLVKK